MWEKNAIISPGKFIKTIQKLAHIKHMDIFSGYAQNDLPEFLIFVIDCFHNSLSREVNMTITGTPENDCDKIALLCFERIKQMYVNDYSEIWNIFYGIHVSQLISAKTEKIIGMTPEPYFIINLPIPPENKSPSLIDCFELYVEDEILDGENGILNETTGEKEAAKKKIVFWSLPTILVIDIKRFNSSNRKKQVLVDFPLNNLDLSKYVIGYNKESYIYDLYGVCNHGGSVLGGHYTSFIKNANGKWYHCNDTDITEVTNPQQIVTPKAYCFFYRKQNL
jgi:ubiquitin C-terminal hydrolase